MKKPIKIIVQLIVCIFVPLTACVSCGKVFAIFSKTDTAGITLDDKEIFLNLTEKFEWLEYRLQNGDTIDLIERKFKISGSIINLALSREGEIKKIPSMSGISHKVENGDTVSLLSRKYHVPQEVIMNVNGIINDIIDKDELFIPNPYILDNFFDSAILKERFIYPVQSTVTRPFGWEYDSAADVHSFHPGIDLHVETGTPVRAVMTGIVYDLGNDPIHGKYVILQHDNYYLTLYSNLSEVSAAKGSYVRQGKIIGKAGNTGDGIEPHLHYGVFRGYNALNPQGMIIDNNEYEFDDIDGFIVQTVNDDNGEAIRLVSYMGSNTDVLIPDTINSLPVREIGDMAFFKRGLTGVTIPDSVTYIENRAFTGNNITRITINGGVVLEKRKAHYDGGFEVEYEVFGLRFDDFYLANGSKAGVYFYRNGSWFVKVN